MTHAKPHHPVSIANYLVEKAALEGRHLDILQLVKLVYLAHGWCLGITDRPLISTRIEAWRYGPVVPEVYEAFRPQGVTIRARAKDENGHLYQSEMDSEQVRVVNKVYDTYKDLEPIHLSYLTHQKGTPWSKMYESHGYYVTIPDNEIHTYYRDLVEAEAA